MKVNFKAILVIDCWGISCEIALRWLSLDLTDDKSTLVQVMAWCCQATSHYLNLCWPRSMSPYGVARPQWVKSQQWSSNQIELLWHSSGLFCHCAFGDQYIILMTISCSAFFTIPCHVPYWKIKKHKLGSTSSCPLGGGFGEPWEKSKEAVKDP